MERWYAYMFPNTKCLYAVYHSDKERLKALNERLTRGGCVFTHAGICTMAANKAWFDMGQRLSPLDFSKYRIILDDKELTTMKIKKQEHEETSLYDIKLTMEFDLLALLCPPLYDFLGNNYECVSDIFQGSDCVFIQYPAKEAAAQLQQFVEGGQIDGYLTDARWVKIEDRYWLQLVFKIEQGEENKNNGE